MASNQPTASAAQMAQQAQQQNMASRVAVLQQALNMWQPIFSQTFTTPTPGQVYNIPVRQVGFTKRFLIEISMTLNVGGGETETLNPQLGPSNILSNVTLNDLSNYTRINTTGWHLWMLSCVKKGFFNGLAAGGMASFQPNPGVWGAAYTNDSPMNAKSNFGVIKAPATYTTSGQVVNMIYEVPCSYNDVDLRGAIYTSVVSATMNLQFTLNPNFFQGSSATDVTTGVYKSSTATLGTIASMTITVHQNYLDQLPFTNQGPILPAQDLSKMYLLTNTSMTGLSVGQDYPIQFPNFRAWQSLSMIYNDAGTVTAGTDISLFQLQTANLTNIWQFDPQIAQLRYGRHIIQDDWPLGTYYFDFRDRPINTNNFGNMQFTVRPSVVNAGANLLLGFEGIGIANQVITAGSIPGN